MDRGPSLSRQEAQSTIPAPGGSVGSPLDLASASQAQIIRAHQRDTSHIHRLTDSASELLQALAGTRWLAHRQTVIKVVVRLIYLVLTFGRGQRTLGEEYTDIIPVHLKQQRRPSLGRRIITILLLLAPTIFTSPSVTSRLRNDDTNAESSWTKAKARIAALLESPLGQALHELHIVAFMFSGQFFEFARRLTGLRYLSTLPPRPSDRTVPTYEPLGLLMLLPVLGKLFHSSVPATLARTSRQAAPSFSLAAEEPSTTTANASEEENIVSTKANLYDTPNTYLTPEAMELPERQCTLCLEPRGTGEGSGGTVAVTECGHIFCWGCLGGLEKSECPLCRQSLRMERLIAAYNL